MPLCHVVTFSFKAETSTEWIDVFGAALDELGAQTPTISYRHGRDAKLRPGNADYCVTAIFEDEAAFTAYLTSREHLRIVSELVAPQLQSRSAVQFSIDATTLPSEVQASRHV
jgi:quinol monooxygenase YgiN